MGRAPDDAVHRAAEAAAPVAAPPRPSAAGAVDAELPGRMLAAIVVRPGVAWFFKLLGPKDAVARHAAEFDALVASLRFAGDAPPEWHAPDGWRQAPAAGMRYATLTIEPAPDPGPTPTPPGEKAGAVAPAADKPLELSVISLPTGGVDELEYVLKNINRWRGQLGVARLSPEQLASASKRVAVDGAEAVVVDIEGTLSPEIDMSKAGGAGGPFAAPNAERPADPGSN
jgi:hypothetical protein